MQIDFRKMLGTASAVCMAISLAACGPDGVSGDEKPFSLFDAAGPLDWPMDDTAMGPQGDGQAAGDWAPLAAAAPMVRSADRSYGYAPAWDYPDDYRYEDASYDDYDEPYYDDAYYDGDPGYYQDSPGNNTYALLALAAVLGGVIGNSPPDYAFDYGGVEPWVWVTNDRYARYAEPLRDGYRYYYYAPGAARPFLVRDPYYSYGYRGDRLVAVYDNYGRVLNERRARSLRRAAASYYDRGLVLHRHAGNRARHGVSAPVWQNRRSYIVTDQNRWERARTRSTAWQSWDRRYEQASSRHWHDERIARRYAAERFTTWQKADYRGPAPRVKRELRSRPQLRTAALTRAVERVRRDERPAGLRRSGDSARRTAATRRGEHAGLTRVAVTSERDARALRGNGRSVPATLRRTSHESRSVAPQGFRKTGLVQREVRRSEAGSGPRMNQRNAASAKNRAAGLRAATRKQPEKVRQAAAQQRQPQRTASVRQERKTAKPQGLQRKQAQTRPQQQSTRQQQSVQRQADQRRTGLQQRPVRQQQAAARAREASARQAQAREAKARQASTAAQRRAALQQQRQVQARTKQARDQRSQMARPQSRQSGLVTRSAPSAVQRQSQRQISRPTPQRRSSSIADTGKRGNKAAGLQSKARGLAVGGR